MKLYFRTLAVIALAGGVMASMPVAAQGFDTFRNKKEWLKVNRDHVDYSDNDTVVEFQAVWDMGVKTAGGHRSMIATIRIDCAGNTYTMPKVEYYSGRSAGGNLIHSESNNDNPPQDFGTGRDVIAQAARKYCE